MLSNRELRQAASQGELSKVKELCVGGADIHAAAQESGMSAVHRAAESGRWEVLNYFLPLLDKGRLNAEDTVGNNVLILVCNFRPVSSVQLEVVKDLLKLGADPISKNKAGVSAFNLLTDIRDIVADLKNAELIESTRIIIDTLKVYVRRISVQTNKSATLDNRGNVSFFQSAEVMMKSREAAHCLSQPGISAQIYGK